MEGAASALPHINRPGKGRGQAQGHFFASVCRRGRESSLHVSLRGTDSPWQVGAQLFRVPEQDSHLQVMQVLSEALLKQQQ